MKNSNRKTKKLKTKFIFISGGVISSVGKGITTASISALLEAKGLKVAPVKCDPYLNVDAGTIRPQEHGEVFVLNDGTECDQDLGNYERFLGRDMTKSNYMTNGQIYLTLITKERQFEFNGEDVEIVPHVPEEIIRRLETVAEEQEADVVICEIGGTVGEYQNILFIEANRIMKYRDNRDCLHIHVGYLPTPPSVGEMKSKPVQNSIRQLNASGIQPDFLIARSEKAIDDRRKETISWICNIKTDNIIAAPNVSSIYEVPLVYEKQGLADKILSAFNIKPKVNSVSKWKKLNDKINTVKQLEAKKIAVVGKYFNVGDYKLADVYISVVESIKHSSFATGVNVELAWVSSDDIEKQGTDILKEYSGIIVPGGFGSRGTEGIIEAIKYARINDIPYLGLCYGMQLAVIEFARNVCGIKDATSQEIDPKSKNCVVHIMPEQEKKLLQADYGASMRLGQWECFVKDGTIASKTYKESKSLNKSSIITERHRHRYEVNNAYVDTLEKNGLVFSGTSVDKKLMEMIELTNHRFFVASQFHPEFMSRIFSPHPLFTGFIKSL